MVKCDICGKEFKNEKGLFLHKRQVHEGKRNSRQVSGQKRKREIPDGCRLLNPADPVEAEFIEQGGLYVDQAGNVYD